MSNRSTQEHARLPANARGFERTILYIEREKREIQCIALIVFVELICVCRATACDADVLTLIRTSVTDKR